MAQILSETQIISSQTQPTSQQIPYQHSVIEIGSVEAVFGIVAMVLSVGIAWGTLKTSVKKIDETLKEIKPDLKNIRERFTAVEDRVNTLWGDEFAPAHSPRQLNDRGNNILKESGIGEIIDQKKNDLFNIIKDKKITNPYDAEIAIMQLVAELPQQFPDLVEKLKNRAFKVGVSVDTLLFIGGIHLRDLIFKDLGFDLDDIDKQKAL